MADYDVRMSLLPRLLLFAAATLAPAATEEDQPRYRLKRMRD